jgi:transcriptional regulator with XRE-family HTH domain
MAVGNEPDWGVNGGAMLRRLRQAAGLTLADVAGRLDDANIRVDAAHLQRIETGQIARPTADTLESILKAGLNAAYLVRRDVLDAYGYRLPWALPTEQEIEEARQLCAPEVSTATWPTYFMDYALRIWGWNRYFPRLIGRSVGDPAIERFIGLTHIEILLNPALGATQQVANAGEFVPLMLTMFKSETRPYQRDPWFLDLLQRGHSWPGFMELWETLPDDADRVLPAQPVLPIEIHVPGVEPVMRFRITHITVAHDPRFRIVHLIPYGATTLRECAMWAEAAGEM